MLTVRKKRKQEEKRKKEKHCVNSVHYVLHAWPKGTHEHCLDQF